jgi:flagellar hook-associated protein 3 FlgL
MTAISRVGTYAQGQNLLYYLLQNQKQLDQASLQLSTGYKSQDWSGYAGQISRLSSLQEQNSTATQFLANIDLVNTRASLTTTATTAITTQAKSFQGLLSTAVPVPTGDTAADAKALNDYVAKMSEQAATMLTSIADLMNSQDSTRYLFGGSNVSSPAITVYPPGTGPTADQTTLENAYTFGSDLAQPPNSATATNAGYRFVINASGTASQTAIQIGATTTTNPQLQLSTNPNRTPWTLTTQPPYSDGGTPAAAASNAFKRLLDGLTTVADLGTSLLTPVGSTAASVQAAYASISSVVSNAKTAVNDALNGNAAPGAALSATPIKSLDSLTSSIAVAKQTAGYAKTTYTQIVQSTTDGMADILMANTTEAAAKVSALSTQLQASYSVLSKVQSLSLLNYL